MKLENEIADIFLQLAAQTSLSYSATVTIRFTATEYCVTIRRSISSGSNSDRVGGDISLSLK